MPCLDITLDGHLLIAGGQASALGVDLATTRRFEDGHWIPYIPATAVRGAVRIQLEALLRGARKPVTGPYPLDEPEAVEPEDNTVSRLFGYSGREGERAGSREGCLRFSDALPVDGSKALRSLRVRTGVEIDDATASVEEKKLFSRELLEGSSQALVFRSQLEIGLGAEEKDVQRLREAAKVTCAIGAGKSTGGGSVRIDWLDDSEPVKNRVDGEAATSTRARLTCTLKEPAHFGDGGPRGNHHGTRTYIPGSTLRGAIAWALLRAGMAPEDEGFKALFLAPGAASFGDGLLAPDAAAAPAILPVTLKQRRDGKGYEDMLARELARSELDRRLREQGQCLRADVRHLLMDPLPARPTPRLVRRVRTRVSMDRHTGTSAQGKLFSIEQVEAWLAPDGDSGSSRQATFVAWIERLTRPAAQALTRLEHAPVYVGAGRNHGMGSVSVKVCFHSEPNLDVEALERRVRGFSEAVANQRNALASRCGQSSKEGVDDSVYLPLVARSEFLPSAEVTHPMTTWEKVTGQPFRRFLTAGHSGGYNQMPDNDREPLKTLCSAVGAGSVFVYRTSGSTLRSLLETSLPELRAGVGGRRESGCGRFDVFEEMSI